MRRGARPRPGPRDDRGRTPRSCPSRKPPAPRHRHRAWLDPGRRHDCPPRRAGPGTDPPRVEVDHRRPRDAGQVRSGDCRGCASPVHRDVLDERGGSTRARAAERGLPPVRRRTPRASPATLDAAILISGLELEGRQLPKGHRLSAAEGNALLAAARAGALAAPVRLAWAGNSRDARGRGRQPAGERRLRWGHHRRHPTAGAGGPGGTPPRRARARARWTGPGQRDRPAGDLHPLVSPARGGR